MKKLTKVPVKREVVKEVVTEEVNQIIEEEGGLITLLGKRVFLLCANYSYSGVLTGVNGSCISLEDTGIVYETGEWNLPKWKDIQKLPSKVVFIQMDAIEAFFEVNK